MPDIQHPDRPRPAQEIDIDLDALRDLEVSEWRLGWSRQFAIILFLVTAFVILVWYGVVRRDTDRPLVYSSGVEIAEDFQSGVWIAAALEQALVATIQAGAQIRLLTAGHAAATLPRFGPGLPDAGQSGAKWLLNATLRSGTPGSETAVVSLTLQRVGQSFSFTTDVVGSANAIGDLAIRSAEQLYLWLELDGVSSEQLNFAQNEIPSAAASEAYGKGLAALQAGDGRGALKWFREADQLAPNTAAIHDGLARAWGLLGYVSNASRESRLALETSQSLSRLRQLEMEAQYALRSGAWPRAQQVFGALKEFRPDDVTYRLAYADTQIRQNDGDGLLESIRQIRAMEPPASEDPRIDLTEAWYWYNAGDYGRCLELARAAEKNTREKNNRLLLGESLVAIGRCDGDYDTAVLLEARDLFKSLDTALREPEILRALAGHELAQGNMDSQLSYLREAVALSSELGNEPQTAASNNALAIAYDLRGWLAKGYDLKQSVAAYQKQRANMSRYAIVLENIGVSLFKMGRYEEADAAIDDAAVVFKDIDDKIGLAWLPYRRGQIALRRGNIEQARAFIGQAIENASERPEGNLALEGSFELGLIHHFSGKLEQAATSFEDTSRQFRDLEYNLSIAESEIALARVNVSAGDLTAARRHLSAAEPLLKQDTTYYSLSLQTEKTNFDLLTTRVERQQACRRLEALAEGQEHKAYFLRARTKIAVCRFMVFGQPLEQSDAILVAVEESAANLGVFEPLIAAGYARARLLHHAGRTAEALQEDARVQQLAVSKDWPTHPMPDLRLPKLAAK